VLTAQRNQLVTMLNALHRLSDVAVHTINASEDNFAANLRALTPTLRELADAGQNLPLALQVLLTYPFTDQVLKDIKGDYLNAGGIFPQADVTYRGVSVGRVGVVRLTSTGVEAELNISNAAPPIPADLQASVADLSAVGEQYVNLRPATSSGPYLTEGSVIPR